MVNEGHASKLQLLKWTTFRIQIRIVIMPSFHQTEIHYWVQWRLPRSTQLQEITNFINQFVRINVTQDLPAECRCKQLSGTGLQNTTLCPTVYSKWKVSISGYESTRVPNPAIQSLVLSKPNFLISGVMYQSIPNAIIPLYHGISPARTRNRITFCSVIFLWVALIKFKLKKIPDFVL